MESKWSERMNVGARLFLTDVVIVWYDIKFRQIGFKHSNRSCEQFMSKMGNIPVTEVYLRIFHMIFHKVNWIKKLMKEERGIIIVTYVVLRRDTDLVIMLMKLFLLLMLKILIVTMKYELYRLPWNSRSEFEICSGRATCPMIIFFE